MEEPTVVAGEGPLAFVALDIARIVGSDLVGVHDKDRQLEVAE